MIEIDDYLTSLEVEIVEKELQRRSMELFLGIKKV